MSNDSHAAPDASSLAHKQWQRVAAVILVVELVALYAPTVRWLFNRWTLTVWQDAQGLLITPLVGYFAYQELKPLAGLPRSSNAWGFAFLIPALVLHALDAGMHTQMLSAVALMLALPGLALLLLGTVRARALAFPLILLVFALPIPLTFVEPIVRQLRLFAATATATVVPWLGVPLFLDGTTLNMANGALEVGDACSGFSTLTAAAAVACLTAYSTPSSTRKLIVLLSAAPLAMAANVLRIVLLVLLVVWKGQAVLDTFLHPLSGLMTFALALPVIFWLGGDPKGAR